MSEQNSGQEKTEEASAHKLKKSKDDGQVARTKDLSTTISLIATLFILKFSAGLFLEGLSDSFRLSYIQFGHSEIGLDDLDTLLDSVCHLGACVPTMNFDGGGRIRADVALGTLYRYFPSKIHLLVTALAREFERVESKVDRSQLRGDTAIDRLRHVLDMITFARERTRSGFRRSR